jgi:hypothetical protein
MAPDVPHLTVSLSMFWQVGAANAEVAQTINPQANNAFRNPRIATTPKSINWIISLNCRERSRRLAML